jgi:hypothetical protein
MIREGKGVAMLSHLEPRDASTRRQHERPRPDRPISHTQAPSTEERAALWPAALMLLLAAVVGIVAACVAASNDAPTSQQNVPQTWGPFHP